MKCGGSHQGSSALGAWDGGSGNTVGQVRFLLLVIVRAVVSDCEVVEIEWK